MSVKSSLKGSLRCAESVCMVFSKLIQGGFKMSLRYAWDVFTLYPESGVRQVLARCP